MDVNKIEELIEVLESSKTEQLCVSKADVAISIRKGRKPEPTAPKKRTVEPGARHPEAKPQSIRERIVRAPMVGIFHRSDGAMKRDASIEVGQVVGAIESMKLLNDVISDTAGRVVEVMVEDGTPVEYGQPLCLIEVV